MSRIRLFVLALSSALLLSACSAQTVDKEFLQTQIANELAQSIQTTEIPAVKCDQKLYLKKGEKTVCTLNDPPSGLTYDVHVTIQDLDEEGRATYNFKVDQKPHPTNQNSN